MDTRTILVKIVTLIYRSKLVKSTENESLIRTILDTIKVDLPEYNLNGQNYIKRFKDYILSFLVDDEPVVKEVILQSLSLVLEHDQKLFTIVKESIEPDYDEASNKRIVTSLVKTLINYYREKQAQDILGRASYDLKFNRNKISNFSQYLQNTISELEPLATNIVNLKDPAVVNEVDFDDPNSVTTIFEEVKSLNADNGVYKLGWQGLNKMTQGGLRRGETVGVLALQHKYKTGSTLSLFMQIALLNTPIVTKEEGEKNLKPLLLRVSFEDDLTSNLQFMYQYLKANEGERVTKEDFVNLNPVEMRDYVTQQLSKTGFRIKMRRVDPNQWTYASLVNYIIELEAQGYAVHVCMVDYLLKMPTTGCLQGALGQDKRDMVRRAKNFFSARKIMFISPYQLSTEAGRLLKNGVPDVQFLDAIAEKNYTDGCGTIGQELDLELYIHLFKHKRKSYLAIKRGKHRLPTNIDEEDKFLLYQFTDIHTPILSDIDRDPIHMKMLPREFDGGVGSNVINDLLA